MYVGICSTIPLIYFVSQFGTIRFTFVSSFPIHFPAFCFRCAGKPSGLCRFKRYHPKKTDPVRYDLLFYGY